MLKTGLILFASLLAGCSLVYPSSDFAEDAGMCGQDLPPYAGPPTPCSQASYDCFASGGNDCAAMASINCVICVFTASSRCVNDNGCRLAWHEQECCLDDACGPINDRTQRCQDGNCRMTQRVYDECARSGGPSGACEAAALPCFPPQP